MTTPHCSLHQSRIWAYFQNSAPESFSAARPRLDFLLRQIARRAQGDYPRVLNVGAGSGYFERRARDRGWKIHTLDPDESTIGRLGAEGIAAHCGAIEQAALPSDHFDFVVASEVLEHLDHDQRRAGIAQVARLLRPGGWFLGTVPYCEDLAANQVVCPACGERFHRWGHQTAFEIGRASCRERV